MSKKDPLSHVHPMHRRELFEKLSLLLASPILGQTVSASLLANLSEKAQAAETSGSPTFFLEVNFRDQWDFGSVFVPPSIAKSYDSLSKDGDEGIAFFNAPTKAGNFYLTQNGLALKEHLDSIAVIETGELVIGNTHGHEAGNAMRSPGRSFKESSGKFDMASVDVRPNGRTGGNEVLYSSTPTPAVLHNAYNKSLNSSLINAILLRSSIRSDVHTFYHFEAALQNAQLDRFFNRKDMLAFFANKSKAEGKDVLALYRKDIVGLVKQLDAGFFKNLAVSNEKSAKHLSSLDLAAKKQILNFATGFEMNASELASWSEGIPGQYECADDDASQCFEHPGTMNIGEMFGYVSKLFQSGYLRTAAVDFDFHDIHTARTPLILDTQGKQTALALARLIQSLKAAGIYDKTVIAMYTLDGSRSPKRNSVGEGSKNALILAGGAIKGGYYGDVSMKGKDVFYHRPDDNGVAIANGVKDASNRIAAQDIYCTVAKAMGIADEWVKGFPDAQKGKILNYMLKKV
jgi:hypothetical protein